MNELRLDTEELVVDFGEPDEEPECEELGVSEGPLLEEAVPVKIEETDDDNDLDADTVETNETVDMLVRETVGDDDTEEVVDADRDTRGEGDGDGLAADDADDEADIEADFEECGE